MLVFDCEIKNLIPDRNQPLDPLFTYCNGWKDYKGMGLAVVAAFDFHSRTTHVYLEDNLEDLQLRIDQSDFVIGYNNSRFDNNVLAASGIRIPDSKSLDLLSEIKRVNPGVKGLGLNAVASTNLGYKKNGFGGSSTNSLAKRLLR